MQKKEKFSFRKYGKVLAPAVIGLAGLTITNTASADEVKSVTTENLAVTPVTVSTPPKVEQPVIANSQEVTTEVIKSPVTYVANDNLEVGKQNVVTQGQAGKLEFSQNNEGTPTVTRTKPTETKVEVGTKPVVKEEVDKHTVTYELDETKNFGDDVEVKGQDGIKKTSTTYKVQTSINPELLLPQSEDEKRFIKTAENLDINSLKTMEEHISSIEALSNKWNLNLVVGKNLVELIPETGDLKSIEDIKRFYNSNYVSNKYIDVINSDYKLAKELVDITYKKYGILATEGEESISKKESVDNLLASLEYLSKLYEENNSITGQKPKVNIYYSERITPEFRGLFEKEVDKLPIEIKRILPTISFEATHAGGLASSKSNRIVISDDINVASFGTLQDIVNGKVNVLLHELGHIVDYKSGYYNEKIDDNNNGKLDYYVFAMSHSPEWLAIWKKYFEKNDNVDGYFSYHAATGIGSANVEAFAESFAQYIQKRVYGKNYTRYEVYDRIGNQTMIGGSSYHREAQHPKYNEAYDIFSKVEPYFERLYNQLFEQPRVAKAVIDKTTTEKVRERVDGKVIYGAKPVERTEVVPYTIVYKADANKEVGFEEEINGKDGKKVIRTSYDLVDNRPVAKETLILDEKAQDRVIIKGTKSKVEEKVVPFVIEYKEDANLAEGQERVETEGVNGVEKTTITYTLDTTTGKVIANAPTITTKPVVNKVIVKGTKKAVVSTPVVTQPVETKEEISVVVKPTETKVETPVAVKPTETKVEVPVVVKPTETKAEIPVFSKGEALFQEEKPNLDESLFTTTSKGESLTETKPELHLIPTVDGSVQVKTEALFQEEKPELPVSLILTNNTQTKTTTSKEDVEKQVLNAVRKLEKRASKETSNKVLPKTTAVSNSSSDIAMVGAIGLALATLLGSRRKK